MIPVSAARSGTRGLPPFGLGRFFGNSGSTTAHNCADTLIREWLGASRVHEATALARHLRDMAPLRQAGWRLLLEATIASGDPYAAVMVADDLERLLAHEDMLPEPATRRLLALASGSAAGSNAEGRERGGLIAELVGREREFSAILTAWDTARAGAFTHLHLTARAGLGKTRLLDDVHARLNAMRGHVVHIRATLGARGISGALAADLVSALAELRGAAGVSAGVASELVALNPALSSRYHAPASRADSGEATRLRMIAIRELVAAVAYEAPVAILVDDLQWADSASLTLLGGVLSKLDRERVLFVSASRPRANVHGVTDSDIELALPPLSVAEVGAMVTSLGELPEIDWAVALPGALHRTADGSPLLVLETLQLALEKGLLECRNDEWRAPDPERLSELLHAGGALQRRLADARAEAGELLVLFAVAGTPLTLDVLATAIEGEEQLLRDRLANLERSGIIAHHEELWQLSHDEYVSAILDAADAEAVRASHAALGRVLFRGAADDTLRVRQAARHLERGGEDRRLKSLFVSFLASARRSHDHRPARAIARDFLGEAGDPSAVSDLVSALPWHVRVGLVTPGRIAAAVAMAALVPITIAATIAAVRQPPLPPPDAILVAAYPDSLGGAALHDFPIRREDWSSGEVLELRIHGAPRWRVPTTLDGWAIEGLVNGYPDGEWWAGVLPVADSGVNDVFDFGPDRQAVRLTALPADDVAPNWAPDGSFLAFQAGGFHPLRHADIAVLDITTGAVRQLTAGEETDATPR